MPPLLQLRDGFFVRQIIGERERVHARRHAILRRLVAQLDDLLDHFAFRLLQCALLFTHLDERLEFFVTQARPILQVTRREAIDHGRADPFEQMSDTVEQGHQRFQSEDAQSGKAVGSRERQEFRDQVTKQNDDRKDDGGGEPLGNARGERSFPDQEKTEHDQGNVDERIREQENVEDTPRVVAEDPDELLQGRMLFLEPAQLMGLEGEERGFEAGEKSGPEDQERDGKEKKGKGRQRHFSLRRRSCNRSPSRRLKRARLPIIAGATKLRPP